MPAISFDVVKNLLPKDKQQAIINSVFGPEKAPDYEASREQSFQDMLNTWKNSVEKQRTDDVRMARLNALGNVLTTMVQPIGWAIGGNGSGVTGGVQPYDNRQYLEAFNRAVKASDDLRNIGKAEAEYRFKMADDEYRRQRALEDYAKKHDIDIENQKQIFDMRSQLNKEQIEGRIKVAEASARARYQFKSGNTRVAETVRDNLLKRANTAYASILSDYYKNKAVGIENLHEPPSYDEFLKRFASENGYQVAESQNASPKAEKKGGFQTGGSVSAKESGASETKAEKKGGFVR